MLDHPGDFVPKPLVSKKPILNRASFVLCIRGSLHLQIVVSLTLTDLKSSLQDFLRVFTQSDL